MPFIPSIDSIWVAGIPVLQQDHQVGVGGEITLLSIEIYEKSETTVCDYKFQNIICFVLSTVVFVGNKV